MAKGGRYLSVKKTKRKGGRVFLIILMVFLLLIAAVAAGGMIYYNSMLNLITRPETTENSLSDADLEAILGYIPEKESAPETEATEQTTAPTTAPTEPAEDPILNIMLIGQNYRKGEEHKLSDTLILCSVNKDTKTITLTSFLRDLYVKLPNYKGHVCGWNRINVAYNLGWRWAGELGGMEMLDTLLYDSFGVEVDYNVEVGFETFTQIIDILGGVDMELTADEARYLSADGKRFTAGMNHLDGEAALTYARIRSSNAGDNDFNRTNRQRKLLVSLINKAKTMSLPQLNGLLQEALPLIITDMTNEEITACAMELLPMLTELTIETNQCPADGTYWGDMIKLGGLDASVIKCELEPNKEIMMQIAEGIEPTEPAETTAE